jgi:hypothetical protein
LWIDTYALARLANYNPVAETAAGLVNYNPVAETAARLARIDWVGLASEPEDGDDATDSRDVPTVNDDSSA